VSGIEIAFILAISFGLLGVGLIIPSRDFIVEPERVLLIRTHSIVQRRERRIVGREIDHIAVSRCQLPDEDGQQFKTEVCLKSGERVSVLPCEPMRTSDWKSEKAYLIATALGEHLRVPVRSS